MPLDVHARRLQRRVFSRYVSSLRSSPDQIVDYLLTHVLLVVRTMPFSMRCRVADRLRDMADVIERAPNRE